MRGITIIAIITLAPPALADDWPAPTQPTQAELACPAGTERNVNTDRTRCLTAEGVLHGPWVRRRASGSLKESGAWHMGKRIGQWVRWDKQGRATWASTWNEDLLSGHSTMFFVGTGTPSRDEMFWEGQLNGTTRDFRRDATVYALRPYKDGQPDGRHLIWNETDTGFHVGICFRGGKALWQSHDLAEATGRDCK